MTEEEMKSICAEISGTPFNYFCMGYETLLKELKDKGIIAEWYYNGDYHYATKVGFKEKEKEIIIQSLRVMKQMAYMTNGLGKLQQGDTVVLDNIIKKLGGTV